MDSTPVAGMAPFCPDGILNHPGSLSRPTSLPSAMQGRLTAPTVTTVEEAKEKLLELCEDRVQQLQKLRSLLQQQQLGAPL